MKSKILFFSILVFFLFVISSVYAGTLTVSVANALTSKALTENEQVTVAVTVTNPSGTETDIITTLPSSNPWFSIVTACSTISTLSAGASGISTCIIKPTSTGTDLTLTAKSEPQSDSSKAGTDSTSGINVASQSSSLTASISGPSSVDTSATFYVGTTVAAPSANDVINAKATISRSVNSQCEIDETNVKASQNLINITKGTTKSVTNWKLTSSSASGTCSVTVNVVSDGVVSGIIVANAGGSALLSKSITVGTPTTTTSAGTTATSAITGQSVLLTVTGKSILAKVSTQEAKAVITIASIQAGSESNFSIDSPIIAITGMTVRTLTNVSNIEITVSKLAARPREVVSDAPGVVNQYLSVDKVNITTGDIEKVTMDFKVEKSWISANSINESTVKLYRYFNDRWDKLDTTKTSENETNVYYRAVSPGLSVFAVAGEAKPIVAPTEKPGEKPVVEFVREITQSAWKIVLIVIVFVVVVIAVIYFNSKSKAGKVKIR